MACFFRTFGRWVIPLHSRSVPSRWKVQRGTLHGMRLISAGAKQDQLAPDKKDPKMTTHTETQNGVPSGPEFLGHVALTLARSTDPSVKTLIQPLVTALWSTMSTVSSVEDQPTVSSVKLEDLRQLYEQRFELQEANFRLREKQLRMELCVVRLRMLGATHQLHTRGLIENFEKDWKALRGIRWGFNDRIELWRLLKVEHEKQLKTAMLDGVPLISKEMFSDFEVTVDRIYKQCSTDAPRSEPPGEVVHVNIDKLSDQEVRIVKALCMVYGVPWRLHRPGRAVCEI